MGASKVGNNIYVEGSGNTLATIASDIADSAWFEDKGSGVYELKGNHELHLRPDGELTIGDPLDYSVYERLDFAASGDNQLSFWAFGWSALRMYGDAHIDFAAGTGHYYVYVYFYATELVMHGDSTYRPSFDGIWVVYTLIYTTSSDHFADTKVDCRYADFNHRIPAYGSTYYWDFRADLVPNVHFYRCTFDGNPAWAAQGDGRGRPPFFSTIAAPNPRYAYMEECTFQHFAGLCYGFPQLGWKDCEWVNNDAYGVLIGHPYSAIHPWQVGGGWADETSGMEWGQWFELVEGANLHDNSTTSAVDFYVRLGTVIALKDCDFQDVRTANLQVGMNGRLLVWTGNTFASGWGVNGLGLVMYVFALDIVVLDAADSPIEGAQVRVQQKDGFECFNFTTDASGRINGNPVISNRCLCSHKRWISGDPVSGSFELWSDGSNSTYHEITVSAYGYITERFEVVMDADKVLAVTLQAASLQDTADAILARVRRLQDR